MKPLRFSTPQLTALVVLRVLIGWHCLYEGVAKLYSPTWSAGGYLLDAGGPFAELFHALAENPTVLDVVDFLNVWGLIAIGLGLMLGVLTRTATLGGIVLLGLYYLSHPPLTGARYALPTEGSYLLVDKNLIEIAALAVLYLLPTGRIVGLDRLLFRARTPQPTLTHA
ncbi:MAG: DoxX subfamily [Catalinimonas sp.]